MPSQSPRRRALSLIAQLMLGATLSACGGGGAAQRDEIRDPQLLTEAEALRGQAQTAVSTGLVGAVFGSQAESASKLYLGAAGRRQLQDGQPLSGSEHFQLASLSKAMTAALAASLVQQGRLRWDSKPRELLPDSVATLHPAYADITLAQLLDHRAGLVALGEPSDIAGLEAFLASQEGPLPSTDTGRRRLISRWLLSLPPAGRPGQDMVYSNAGYTVAGAMLEAASGQDFETLMRHWAAPLGLQPAWLPPTDAPQGHEGASPAQWRPYEGFDPALQPWVDAIKPAGDVWLSTADYGRWLAEHQRALQGKGHALPPDYVQRLRTLKPGEYALGWQGSEVDGHAALVHSGADRGFMGLVLLRRDGQRAWFALSNGFGVRADGSSWVLEALNQGLLNLARR